MAKEYEIEVSGHPSIYDGTKRNLKIYFNEPNNGISNKTGIVLFIPGFGANSKSKVYKKMRNNFADEYNLVTVQCDYFGNKYMQLPQKLIMMNKIYTYSEIEKMLLNHNYKIKAKAVLSEKYSNFNDMGIMQAIDNISAVLAVINILKDNNLKFNKGKIIVYGHSHGGYLAYLVNAFAPNLISLIIDNSAWILPEYLNNNRYLTQKIKNSLLQIEFDYMAKNLDLDHDLYNLNYLYGNFKNKSKIISFHGIKDSLVSFKEKQKLSSKVKKFELNKVTEKNIDHFKFNSTKHGLGADFLNLFDYTINKDDFFINNDKDIGHSLIQFKTPRSSLIINHTKGLPLVDLNYHN